MSTSRSVGTAPGRQVHDLAGNALPPLRSRCLTAYTCSEVGDYCGYFGMPSTLGTQYDIGKARFSGKEFRWSTEGGVWVRVR